MGKSGTAWDNHAPRIGLRTWIAYGVGSIAIGVKSRALLAFLMVYYNQVLGLPVIVVSTVLMASLIFDAIIDPLLGEISDKFRSRWGRRHPFMYASAAPTGIFFVLLWLPPAHLSQTMLIAYLTVCLVGLRFFDTLFELPRDALVPELTSDYNERTSVFAAGSIGTIIGSAGIYWLALAAFMKSKPNGTGGLLDPNGYELLGLFAGVVVFAGILLSSVGLHHLIPRLHRPGPSTETLAERVREALITLRSRAFIVVAFAYACVSAISALSASLDLYIGVYFFQFSEAQLAVLAGPAAIAAIVGLALTSTLTARTDKRNGAILLCWIQAAATAASVLVSLSGLLAPSSDGLLALVAVQRIVGGAAYLMLLVTLTSILADLVEDTERRTRQRSEALLFSANSFTRKAASAAATLGAGLILAATLPTAPAETSLQSDPAAAMGISYLSAQLILALAATLLLLFYKGTAQTHAENVRAIAAQNRR